MEFDKLKNFAKATGVLLLFSLFIFYLYLPSYTRLKKLREENNRVRQAIEEMKEEIARLKRDIQELEQGNTYLWEKLARQNLGVIKKNEIVVDMHQEGE